ncbi:MAG: response regulator transcription factor [Anaerolineaceae bacterium]|nr:response regulator transcription factor [Anaerolineaceae bacterium]
MTRLLYLPDDSTLIQLDVDLNPADLVTAINAGLRPLPLLRSAPNGRLFACQMNATVIVAPQRLPGRPATKLAHADLTQRQKQVLELSTRGFNSTEIADMLNLSRRAVNYHLSQLRVRIRGELPAIMKSNFEENEQLL